MSTIDNNSTLRRFIGEKVLQNITPALNSNILQRTSSSTRGYFKRGATALKYVFGPNAATTTKGMVIGSPLRTSRHPLAQKVVVPHVEALEGDMLSTAFPQTAKIYVGVRNGTPAFGDVSGNDVSLTTAGLIANGVNTCWRATLLSYNECDAVHLIEGLKVGIRPMIFGAPTLLGDFLAANTDMRDASMFVLGGVSNTFGPLDTQRALSAMVQASGGAGGGYGFGTTSLTDILNTVSLLPTVTVNPPSDPDVAKMKFIIKAGARCFEDNVLMDKESGTYFNCLDDINMEHWVDLQATGGPVFIRDFVVDFDKHVLTDVMTLRSSGTTDVIQILAGEVLDASITMTSELVQAYTGSDQTRINFTAQWSNITLYLASGSGSGLNVTRDMANEGAARHTAVPDFTSDRNYSFFASRVVFPTGTVIPSQLTIRQGMELPRGFLLPEGSATSDISSSFSNLEKQNVIRFGAAYAVLDQMFTVDGSAMLVGVVDTEDPTEVPQNSITLIPQSILLSSKWSVPCSFEKAAVSAGHVTQTWIRFAVEQFVTSGVRLTDGSLITAGSVISSGLVTRAGMKAMKDSTFTLGTVVYSDLDLSSIPMELSNGVDGNNPIAEGSVITALGLLSDGSTSKTSLPIGFRISNGNKLPALLKVQALENVSVKMGTILDSCNFGPGFVMSALALAAGWEFATNTILSANVTLPAGTLVSKGNKFPYEFPLPNGFKLPLGSKVPVGMKFASGATLPGMSLRSQEDGLRNTVASGSDAPYLIAIAAGKTYAVFRENTVFGRDFVVPKGFVALKQNGFDTHATTDPAITGSVWVNSTSKVANFQSGVFASGAFVLSSTSVAAAILDQAEYTFGDHGSEAGVSLEPLSIFTGLGTANPIVLRGQWRVPFDCAVPLLDNTSVLKKISFPMDFVINREVILDSELLVNDEHSTFQPADTALPWDLTLSCAFTIPSDTTVVGKKIALPVDTGFEYEDSILENQTSWIKLPGHATSSKKKIRVTWRDMNIGTASLTASSNAYLEIPAGSPVNFAAGYYQLRAPMDLSADWTINQPIVSSPAFVVLGMRLPAGSKLPGNVNIGTGVAFPEGLTTASEIVLAEDHTVNNALGTPLLLPSGSLLSAGSMIQRDSVFAAGCELLNVLLGPVNFWNDNATLTLYHGQKMPDDLIYRYFADGNYYKVNVDNEDQLRDIMNILTLLQTR